MGFLHQRRLFSRVVPVHEEGPMGAEPYFIRVQSGAETPEGISSGPSGGTSIDIDIQWE